MNKNGPIIIIDDDQDDQEILQVVFKRLNYKNEVIFFSDGEKAIEYLCDPATKPFIVLSDINMPRADGFEVRSTLFTNKIMAARSVPYLFFTNGTYKKAVVDAYAMSVQGFFIKPTNMAALENTLRKIIEYWQECVSPTNFD